MNKCPHIQLTQEIIDYVLDYVTDENLLRSGGIPTAMLDKAAFGFSKDSVKTLMPDQLKIRWKEDLENVKWEIEKQGLPEEQWAQYIDLTEPIEVEYWKNEEEGFEEGLYISDGHHRYYAAKILGKPLNVELEMKVNPIEKLTPGIGYDNFHRCLFKQVKEEYGYKEISKNFLNQFIKNVTDRVARDFVKGWIEREGGDKVLLSKKEYFILQGIQRNGKVPKTSTNEVRKIVREVLRESVEHLDFRDEHLGSQSGQDDMELGLYINNEIIGMVQYTLYDGEMSVKDILVSPEYRRKGYGSRMMQYIKKAHPEYEYKPSMMTDLGAKFKHKEMVNEIDDVIEETFEGQKDLEKFTNEILKSLGDRTVKEREHMEFLVAGVEGESPELKSLPMMFTGTMKNDGYDEAGEFVEKTSIKIIPTTLIDGREETKGMLSYGSPQQNLGREIFEIRLKYNQGDLDEINQLFNEKKYGEVTGKDVYFKIYYMFYSSLLHEIQHAYDAWRSKGKALAGSHSKKFIASQEKAKSIVKSKDSSELTPEEIEAISNGHKEYQNLVHEINARYAQAMHGVRISTMDDKWNEIMNSWDKVYRSFQFEFDGWRNLSDKMKRKLTRRLAKSYQKESEQLQTAEEKFGKDIADEVGAMEESFTNVRNIVKEILKENFENKKMIDEALDADYKKWKRKNVTIRGVAEMGSENSSGASFGRGLYTAFLSNKELAKEYGKVYFVVGAIPKNPMVFSSINQAEIWMQHNLYNFEGEKFPNVRRFREEGKTIEGAMQELGYDGIVIKGREMVNYTPGEDIKYYNNENELVNHYEYIVKNK